MLAHIPMDFPDGSSSELVVRRGDDPRALVTAFCKHHGCSGPDLRLLVGEVHRRYKLAEAGACPPGLRPASAAAVATAAAGSPAALVPSLHCVCSEGHRPTTDGLGCARVRCFGSVCSADWRWLEGRVGRAAVARGHASADAARQAGAAALQDGKRGGHVKRNSTTSSGVAYTVERDDFGEDYSPGDVFDAADTGVQPLAWRAETRSRGRGHGQGPVAAGGLFAAFAVLRSPDWTWLGAATPVFALVGALAFVLARLVWQELLVLSAMPASFRRRMLREKRQQEHREAYRQAYAAGNAGRGKMPGPHKSKAGAWMSNRSGAPKGRVGKKV